MFHLKATEIVLFRSFFFLISFFFLHEPCCSEQVFFGCCLLKFSVGLLTFFLPRQEISCKDYQLLSADNRLNLTVKGRAVPNPVNIHPKFEQKLNVSLKARAWMIVQTNRPSNSSARISERD